MSVAGWTLPDDPLGAFCRHNHVALGGSGKGSLAGLTFAVKDLFHIRGHRTGFGHPDWLATHPAITRVFEFALELVGDRTHVPVRAARSDHHVVADGRFLLDVDRHHLFRLGLVQPGSEETEKGFRVVP